MDVSFLLLWGAEIPISFELEKWNYSVVVIKCVRVTKNSYLFLFCGPIFRLNESLDKMQMLCTEFYDNFIHILFVHTLKEIRIRCTFMPGYFDL